jgi:hypothetical protein
MSGLQVKHWLMLGLSTFLGAAFGALTPQLDQNPGLLLSKQTAMRAGLGAVLVGVIAVVHLFQPPPKPSASTGDSQGRAS